VNACENSYLFLTIFFNFNFNENISPDSFRIGNITRILYSSFHLYCKSRNFTKWGSKEKGTYLIHDAIYFAMCRKFITRLSSVLTMLEHNGEYTAATTSCSIFATMICRVSLR